jgi:hypothetical protein
MPRKEIVDVKLAAPWLALKVRDGLAAVAEWEAEHGALTEAELNAARQRLVAARRPARALRRRRGA